MNQASFSATVNELSKLVDERQSGQLFITTETNHASTVTLVNGDITAVRYRIRRGSRALSSLLELGETRCSHTFTSADDLGGFSPVTDEDLPSTADILQRLSQASPSSASAPAATPAPAELPAAFKQLAVDVLARYIGPMASIVGEQVFAEAASVEAALNKLKSKLTSTEQVTHFERELEAFL